MYKIISNVTYKILLLAKLIRLRKVLRYATLFLRKMRIGIDMSKLIVTLATFILTIHIIANLWAALATTRTEQTDWIKASGNEDNSVIE
jgi:hypothetical protein